MIIRYELFLENKIIDSINEGVLYLSSDLSTALSYLSANGFKIAGDILGLNGEEIKPDMTLIDIAPEDGYFSFITDRVLLNKLKEYTGDTDPDLLKRNAKLYLFDLASSKTLSRQSVRIGKFINKLFPNKYKDDEIESFVNKFKSVLNKESEKFSLIDGVAIEEAYQTANYLDEERGSLASSCMNDFSYLDIYFNNPDKCKMLILTEFDKIKGRALVWKVENQEFEWFMDRQYTNYEADILKMRDWAESKGWAYRAVNRAGFREEVIYKGVRSSLQMEVNLPPYSYDSYPYLDTFVAYEPDKGILRNYGLDNCLILNGTDGNDFEDLREVYSEYYDYNIPAQESVWSAPLRSYLRRQDSVMVRKGSQSNIGWWPDDHEDIVYTSKVKVGLDGSYYLHKSDAIYSDVYRTWILKEESILIISRVKTVVIRNEIKLSVILSHVNEQDTVSKEIVSEMMWYKKITESKIDVQYSDSENDDTDFTGDISEYDFHMNCFINNYKSELIPSGLFIHVIVSKYDGKSILLSKQDAVQLIEKKLNVKSISDQLLILDLVEYNTTLSKTDVWSKLDNTEDRMELVYDSGSDKSED